MSAMNPTAAKWSMVAILAVAAGGWCESCAAQIDLGRAIVVVPDGLSGPEHKAVRMLVDEVRKRSGIGWDVLIRWPTGRAGHRGGSARLAETIPGPYGQQVRALATGKDKEGFRIETLESDAGAPAVVVVGNDARGVLFGVGRLLRELHMKAGSVSLPARLSVATAPKYPLRGHQLGYRPKTNSYDAWDLPQWERYIRELAVFGTNAIELIPPRSDDDRDSPHFPLPPLEMMAGMSQIAADYGLDVWIWYPAMDADYADPKTVEHALAEWGEVFRKLPRIDAVFVPGGDPGHTHPKVLMALLEKQAENLRRFHPNAQMWVSPQSFNQAWLAEFLAILHSEPDWLGGVVYGPQVRISLPELRKVVPAKYPIRDYPDITHSLRCQYPVPDWDVAYSLTEGREVINPRPRDEAAIFHAFARQTIGFITYSEGCNDDVNKIVWSALGWDPEADVLEVLRQYSRYLVGLGPGETDGFAHGLLALEENWRGPLLTNGSVETTLAQFRTLESRARPRCPRKLAVPAGTLPRVLRRLRPQPVDPRDRSGRSGALPAARSRRRSARWRRSTRPSGFSTGQTTSRWPPTCGSGSSRWPRHFFRASGCSSVSPCTKRSPSAAVRPSTRSTLRSTTGNGCKIVSIRSASSTARRSRRREIDAIINWTNPGPGGFYDDLGDPRRRPHLVMGGPYEKDPAFLHAPMTGFDQEPAWRRSWCRHGGALYDQPLRLHYTGLDPAAAYKVARGLHRRHVSGKAETRGRGSDRITPVPRQAAGHDPTGIRRAGAGDA